MSSQYKIRKMTPEEFHPLWMEHKFKVFDEDHSYPLWDMLSKEEIDKANELRKHVSDKIEICLGVFDEKDRFVGWSWGFQDSSISFYMANSAILEEHRRKGLYTRLVDEMVSYVSNLGFQLVYSRHCATNNSVIIPKLKAGFLISKMEMDDIFGVLIHLHYYPNKTRRKIMDYRSGQKSPDAELKKLFKL
ncbi:MAG: GNAT family N-acetyltransferase [Bacteriovoracaceae bacterium]|nr:GNAT family N-acetyltransferase [Bacteriovoracaceae bacterium]